VQILHEFPGTVVGTLAGHAHCDGLATDEAGLHHRVCKAVLETPPGRWVAGVLVHRRWAPGLDCLQLATILGKGRRLGVAGCL
jgi:hypothetical protein